MRMEIPEWLVLPAPDEQVLARMKELLDQSRLHTVCESADCPNIGECFGNKTCTFMILGNTCSRNCGFCAVSHGSPQAVDACEPRAVALTAKQLGLQHIVVTSVTRDDLPDGGAAHFAATIQALRAELPKASVEVLIPDFQGGVEALNIVLAAKPDIINHNIETVPRLYPAVRPEARYKRSLELLGRVHAAGASVAKSGLMVGLGEKADEVVDVIGDLYRHGCRMLTIGQYLSPSRAHLPVREYVHPDQFRRYEQEAYKMGYSYVSSGPLVRSSYHAGANYRGMNSK